MQLRLGLHFIDVPLILRIPVTHSFQTSAASMGTFLSHQQVLHISLLAVLDRQLLHCQLVVSFQKSVISAHVFLPLQVYVPYIIL